MFPKIGVPQNGWFIMENLIKMGDLGVPLLFGNTHESGQIIIFHQPCGFPEIAGDFPSKKLPFGVKTRVRSP